MEEKTIVIAWYDPTHRHVGAVNWFAAIWLNEGTILDVEKAVDYASRTFPKPIRSVVATYPINTPFAETKKNTISLLKELLRTVRKKGQTDDITFVQEEEQ